MGNPLRHNPAQKLRVVMSVQLTAHGVHGAPGMPVLRLVEGSQRSGQDLLASHLRMVDRAVGNPPRPNPADQLNVHTVHTDL